MNAVPHREVFSSPFPYDPMGFGQATADLMMAYTRMGLQTSQITIHAFQQAAKYMTSRLPPSVEMALIAAQQKDKVGLPIAELSYDITSTSIKGLSVPIDVSVEKISETCSIRHFTSRGASKHRHRLLYVSPISGSTATISKPLVSLLLPAMDVSVTEFIAPQNLALRDKKDPKRIIKFALAENFDDLIACDRSVIALEPNGFSAFGLSQGGSALTMAAPHMVGLENVIIAASPINTRVNPSMINVMARLNQIPERIISQVGSKYVGEGRSYISADVMHALHSCIPDKPDKNVRRQDLIAEHTIETHHEFFQRNSLATGQLRIHGERLNFSNTRVRLMTLSGKKDSLVPEGQPEAAKDIFYAAKDYIPISLDTDHYGFARPGSALNATAQAIIAFTGCDL